MGKSRSTFQPTPEASASLVLARTRSAVNFGQRPALLIARYFRSVAEEQSGDRRGGVLGLVLSISVAVADDLCWIAPDMRKFEHRQRWRSRSFQPSSVTRPQTGGSSLLLPAAEWLERQCRDEH